MGGGGTRGSVFSGYNSGTRFSSEPRKYGLGSGKSAAPLSCQACYGSRSYLINVA